MTSDAAVAQRYAKPLIDMAQERNALEAVYQDMLLFAQVCQQNRQFMAILENPIIRGYKKSSILKALFAQYFNALTMALFELMAKKDREGMLYQTSLEFIKLYDKSQNIEKVEVTSALPLSEEEVEKLKQKFASQLGKTIILTTKIDPSLIGGLVVKVGDNQIDDSIKQNLQRIKQKLLSQSL